MIYFIDGDEAMPTEKLIKNLMKDIKDFISNNRLSINEEKIGFCLIDVFEKL